VDIDHPKIGKTRVVGPVAKLSETPATIRSLSPSLGEHTAEVLRDFLGMDAAAIAGLRADGVIAAEK
jgi:crotonobetainyl-CoA:carnitine CoA-transferase CaiB-like acyl-CoA transferase